MIHRVYVRCEKHVASEILEKHPTLSWPRVFEYPWSMTPDQRDVFTSQIEAAHLLGSPFWIHPVSILLQISSFSVKSRRNPPVLQTVCPNFIVLVFIRAAGIQHLSFHTTSSCMGVSENGEYPPNRNYFFWRTCWLSNVIGDTSFIITLSFIIHHYASFHDHYDSSGEIIIFH
jgi:hypothetical protein